MARVGGFRKKSRAKLKKNIRARGKFSLTNYFQEFKTGEKVILKADSTIQKGMYFPRFHSKCGIIKGKKGKCYEILIKDFKKDKLLIVHPIHLKRV